MQDELPKSAFFYQPEKLISTSCHSPLSYKEKPTVKIFLTLGLSKKLNSLSWSQTLEAQLCGHFLCALPQELHRAPHMASLVTWGGRQSKGCLFMS